MPCSSPKLMAGFFFLWGQEAGYFLSSAMEKPLSHGTNVAEIALQYSELKLGGESNLIVIVIIGNIVMKI